MVVLIGWEKINIKIFKRGFKMNEQKNLGISFRELSHPETETVSRNIPLHKSTENLL